ncbi:hypothetical protein D3C76_764330 [compost metagenome]
MLRAAAPVFTLPFQQVVGLQYHWRITEQLLAQGLAAQALLQQGERLHGRRIGRGAGLPDQNLAVEDDAVGQVLCQCVQLREALGDQFLTSRPDPQLAVALDHLGAYTVPLPFDLPVARRAEQAVEVFKRGLQRMRQEERVRLATALAVLIGRLCCHQFLIAGGSGAVADIGVADQALGHALGIQVGQLCQRPGDQQLGDADAKAAGDQLQAQHQTGPVELRPQGRQLLVKRVGGQPAQRQQAIFNPLGQASVTGVVVFGQDQGNGLGQVTHRLVAFFEQPVRQAGQGARQFAQHTGGHQLTWPPASEEVHGPRGVLGRGLGKVLAQGLELGVAGRGRIQAQVQRGEGFHAGCSGVGEASSSSPYSVTKPRASRPCSLR